MANDYTLNWSNGGLKPSFVLTGGTIDTTTTSLSLTGKGSANWGEPLQENLLKLMEHFASNVAPTAPTFGQIWFDSSTRRLYFRDTDSTWKQIGVVNGGGPNQDGDIQVVGSVISIWANGAFRQVFPAQYS